MIFLIIATCAVTVGYVALIEWSEYVDDVCGGDEK